MGVFFIDTGAGQVATLNQLVEAGLVERGGSPPAPWHRIQGPDDASTLWYAVLRKRVARKRKAGGGAAGAGGDIFIGALAIRHQPHHASLLEQGWEEVGVEEIAVPAEPRGASSMPGDAEA